MRGAIIQTGCCEFGNDFLHTRLLLIACCLLEHSKKIHRLVASLELLDRVSSTLKNWIPLVLTMNSPLSSAIASSLVQVPELPLDDIEDRRAEAEKQQRIGTTLTVGLVVATMGVAAVALTVAADSIITFVAFVIPIALGPYIIRQRRQLNKLPTLKEVLNLTRIHANKLHTCNQQFQKENDRLTREIYRLEGVEDKLKQTAKENNVSIDYLQTLVNESGQLQRQIQQQQSAKELQNLLSAIFRADTDNNKQLSENELHMLMIQLRHYSSRPILNEDRLRDALRASKSDVSMANVTLAHFMSFEMDSVYSNDQTTGGFV